MVRRYDFKNILFFLPPTAVKKIKARCDLRADSEWGKSEKTICDQVSLRI
jgi:hypothetical protein